MNQRDIFLISLFIAFHEMLSQDVLTMDMLQNIFSENVITYTFLAGALSFFRAFGKYDPDTKQWTSKNARWKNNATLQGKSIYMILFLTNGQYIM